MDETIRVESTTPETSVTKSPRSRSHLLKALQPDTYGTGRWTYNGKNLRNDEVEALTDKGVDWVKDLMPDGRLKLPKFRFHRKPQKKQLTPQQLRENDADRRARYDALTSDPKPDYFEWAAMESRKEQFAQLERDAFCANRPSDRLKAIATLLEFSKSKPKQTIGVETDTKEVSIDPKELLEFALRENGIGLTADQFKELAEQRKA